MRWAAWLLFIGQLVLVVLGAKASPDYYARSAESVAQWAYSTGLGYLLSSCLLAVAIGLIAFRSRRPITVVAAVICAGIALVWLLRPLWISVAGDGLFFRFP